MVQNTIEKDIVEETQKAFGRIEDVKTLLKMKLEKKVIILCTFSYRHRVEFY